MKNIAFVIWVLCWYKIYFVPFDHKKYRLDAVAIAVVLGVGVLAGVGYLLYEK